VSTVRVGSVRFHLRPEDHSPVHAHGRCGETSAIVELFADGFVALARRPDAVGGRNPKRSDIRRILIAARDHYDEIAAAWEVMHVAD